YRMNEPRKTIATGYAGRIRRTNAATSSSLMAPCPIRYSTPNPRAAAEPARSAVARMWVATKSCGSLLSSCWVSERTRTVIAEGGPGSAPEVDGAAAPAPATAPRARGAGPRVSERPVDDQAGRCRDRAGVRRAVSPRARQSPPGGVRLELPEAGASSGRARRGGDRALE